MNPSSLLLVGCGKMGGALLSRWQKNRPSGIRRFRVIDPIHKRANTKYMSWFAGLDDLPPEYEPSVILFAVKPQHLPAILPAYRERFHDKRILYMSIAAGKSLRFFMAHLGERAHVIRAMPNTAALVGESITVMCAAQTVSPQEIQIATDIMEAVGRVIWLQDESQMDAVTALSGSGPAYVFLFLDSLIKAGIAAGLPEDTAKQLALATVYGSSAMASQSTRPFESLRKDVTSTGGTTEAALTVLMKDNLLESLIKDAILKATDRSKELSK